MRQTARRGERRGRMEGRSGGRSPGGWLRLAMAAAGAVVFLAPGSWATDRYVNSSGGSDSYDGLSPTWNGTSGAKASIQAAINSAASGDTITVAQGTYTGAINFGGRNLTLRSTDPGDWTVVYATVINGGGGGMPATAVTFSSSETSAAVLSGFTVTTNFGRGISCSGASPTITSCRVKGNSASAGGGIYLSGSSAVIRNCLIYGNYTGMSGAGGVFSQTGSPTIVNCTLAGNSGGAGGAFAGGLGIASGSATLRNCILWGNTYNGNTEQGYVNGSASVSYCCVQNGTSGIAGNVSWGSGILSSDPLFADSANADYHLKSTQGRWNGSAWASDAQSSPCIDAGCPSDDYSLEPAGNGSRVNQGAFANTPEASRSSAPGPQFATSVSALGVPEGSTAQLTLCLSQAPAANVTAALSLDTGADADLSITSSLSLSFTTTTWATPQTITLAAAEDDADAAAGTATLRITATGLSDETVALTEIDDEVTLTVAADAGGTASPAGATVRTPGDVVAISATPGANVQFDAWTGDTTTVANPAAAQTTVTVNDDTSLLATFILPFVTYYTDAASGSNSYDGLSPTVSGGHGPKANIQSAIEAAYNDTANSGELIIVLAGTYAESLNFRGLDITVTGVDPEDSAVVAATIVSAPTGGTAVTFNTGETSASVLSGLTLTSTSGRGILCSGASPTIRCCRIRGNSSASGGGIYLSGSSAAIRNCLIYGNFTGMSGAGGIYSQSGSPTIENCTLAGNSANAGGALAGGLGVASGSATVRNCILWGNTYNGTSAQGTVSGSAAISYGCIQSGTGGITGSVSWGLGIISADPLFADSANGNYQLQSAGGRWNGTTWVNDSQSSPGIDAGDPSDDYAQESQPNGGRVNLGFDGNTALASRSESAGPEFVLMPGSLTVAEGGNNSFTVTLTEAPAAAVAVTVARASGDTDISVTSGASFNLDATNWSTGQSVTLSAAEDDADAQAGEAVISVQATGLTTAQLTATEADDDASLAVTGATPSGTTIHELGSVVEITPAPPEHYLFSQWAGDVPAGQQTQNPLELTLIADSAITAQFALVQHTVSATCAHGTVSGTGSYGYGTQAQLGVTAAAGYHFDHWTGDVPAGHEADNPLVLSVTADASLTAVCAADLFVFSTTALAVPEGGSAEVQVALAAAPTGSVTVTVTLAAGSDGDLGLTAGASLTFTTLNWGTAQAVTVAAAADADSAVGTGLLEFSASGLGSESIALQESEDDATLTASAGTGGTVSPVGTLLCSKGQPVNLTATPAGGYEFDRWTGDTACLGDTLDATTTATLTADASVQATFREPGCIWYVDAVSGAPAYDGLSPVFDGVHGPARAIGTAVTAAQSGDTIMVAEGVYTESVDLGGKDLTVRSHDPEDPDCVLNTVLEHSPAAPSAPVLNLVSGETAAARIVGLHIRDACCGILVADSAATIRGCRFSNITTASGAAIMLDGASAEIDGIVILGLSPAQSIGNGVCAVDGSSLVLRRALIAGNAVAGSAIYGLASAVTVDGCTIACNDSPYTPAQPLYFIPGQHAIRLVNSTGVVTNSILWENDSGFGQQISLEDSALTVSYSDLQGGSDLVRRLSSTLNWGLGMLDTDPLFADPEANDFQLKSWFGRWDALSAAWVGDTEHSPCIDAGDPASDLALEPLPNGGRVNQGAQGNTPEASLGVLASDHDGDLLSGFLEYAVLLTDPREADTDGDGMDDGWEWLHGLDPLADDAGDDPDGDGLSNAQEYADGTLPEAADSDGDGMDDAWEIAMGQDPMSGWTADLMVYWDCAVRSGAWLRDRCANRSEDGIIRGETAGYDGLLGAGAGSAWEGAGEVLVLEGDGQGVVVPGGGALDLSGDFTLALSVRFGAFPSPSTPVALFWKGTAEGGVEAALVYCKATGVLRYFHVNGTLQTDVADFGIDISAGQWTDLALTVGAQGVRAFAGGTLLGTAPAPTHARDRGGDIRLGAGLGTGWQYLQGALDEVRLYRVALDAAAVAALRGAAADTDGDGITAIEEYILGLDPRVDDATADSDGDGLTNAAEVLVYHTDCGLADSDGDGVDDGAEVAAASDATRADQGSDTGGPVIALSCPAEGLHIGF